MEEQTWSTLRPFGRRVLVTDPPADPQRRSGLILPPGASGVAVGIVVDAGEGVELDRGARVFYAKGCGHEIRDEGSETFRVVDADCIVAWEPAP